MIPEAERTDFNPKPQSIAKIAESTKAQVFSCNLVQIGANWCNLVQFRVGTEEGVTKAARNFLPPAGGILRRDKCNKRDKAVFAGGFCVFEVCTKVCTEVCTRVGSVYGWLRVLELIRLHLISARQVV